MRRERREGTGNKGKLRSDWVAKAEEGRESGQEKEEQQGLGGEKGAGHQGSLWPTAPTGHVTGFGCLPTGPMLLYWRGGVGLVSFNPLKLILEMTGRDARV